MWVMSCDDVWVTLWSKCWCPTCLTRTQIHRQTMHAPIHAWRGIATLKHFFNVTISSSDAFPRTRLFLFIFYFSRHLLQNKLTSPASFKGAAAVAYNCRLGVNFVRANKTQCKKQLETLFSLHLHRRTPARSRLISPPPPLSKTQQPPSRLIKILTNGQCCIIQQFSTIPRCLFTTRSHYGRDSKLAHAFSQATIES